MSTTQDSPRFTILCEAKPEGGISQPSVIANALGVGEARDCGIEAQKKAVAGDHIMIRDNHSGGKFELDTFVESHAF